MKHSFRAAWLLLLPFLVLACQAPPPVQSELATLIPPGVPQSGQPFVDDPDSFHFVIVGDRTAGHRPGVWSRAMEQINLLRPEFVISVGDHIEGHTEDQSVMEQQWQELDEQVDRLAMRFIYVPGNHDLSNETMRQDWLQRRGREYYHFVYKDVLFIALSTEDPPGRVQEERARRLAELGVEERELEEAVALYVSDPQALPALLKKKPVLAQALKAMQEADEVSISDEQVAYVRQALQDQPDARWTMVFMHRPAWLYDSPAFEEIEAMLKDRPHTFFAGHLHAYSHMEKEQTDYIQLGTTGGMMNTNPEQGTAMDHILWVTMTADGPEIANLELNGIHPRQGPRAGADR